VLSSDKFSGSARRLGPAHRLGSKDLIFLCHYFKGPGLGLALPAAKLGFYSAILSPPTPAGLARRLRPQALLPYSQVCMPAGSFWGPQSTIAELGI